MRVRLNSVLVDDQMHALKFYTEKLGFVVKTNIPAGGARWITVVPPDEMDGPELLLEPTGMDEAKIMRRALYEKGIPLTMLASDNVQVEYEKLKAGGVAFKMPPQKTPDGNTTMTIFDDTCGNYIVMYEVPKK
jgi:uncharacterized glyoxalase superfamily protein PhnB